MLITDRDYCKAILISKNMGLSSVEKFFLIRVVCSFGVFGEVLATVDTLEKRLYLSEAVLKRTRNSLLKKGYLTDLPDPVSNGGRPRKCFKITTHCLELLQVSALDAELCNREWIEELLFNGALSEICVPDRSGKTRKIRPPVRILMGVLLAYSSDVGLVSDLGHADLRRLIGSSLDCLKSQMSTLHEVGFILAIRPGFTHRQTGKLFKGQYALNFAWDGLCGKLKAERVVFCLGKSSRAGGSRMNKDHIVNLQYTQMMNDFRRRSSISSHKLSRLTSMLGADIKRYIAWSISEFSYCFSNRWVGAELLCDSTISVLEKELKSQVRFRIESILDEDSLEDEFNFICDFVYFYAYMLARKTIIISGSIYKGRKEGLSHFLIPNDYNPEEKGICILIFNRCGLGINTAIQEVAVVGGGENKVRLISTHENMNEIEIALKAKYGFV